MLIVCGVFKPSACVKVEKKSVQFVKEKNKCKRILFVCVKKQEKHNVFDRKNTASIKY